MGRPRPFHRLCALLGAALLLGLSPGPASADEAAERRAQIGAQRAEIQRQFREGEADCRRRFAVSGCLEEVRARRRAALDPLDREEAALDDVDRRTRAARRLESIERRQREQAGKPAASLPVQGGPEAAASMPLPRDVTVRPPRTQQALTPGERSAAEAAYRERQRDAEARQAAVRRREAEREAERAAKGQDRPPPLPAPGAAPR